MQTLALAAMLALAGPPVLEPSGEGAVYEPETPQFQSQAQPQSQSQPQPTPTPVDDPTLEPRPDDAADRVTPARQEQPEQRPAAIEAVAVEPVFVEPTLPPPPPPPDGAGKLVGGSISLGLGAAAIGIVAVESTREDGLRTVAPTLIPLGLVAIGVGTYFVIRGAKSRANLLDWRSYTDSRERPSGEGLIVGGTMSTVIGGVVLVAAGVQTSEATEADRARTIALWSVGGAAFVSGALELTFGLLRRRHYRTWRQRTYLGRLQLSPTGSASARGFTMGVAGRF